VGMVHSGSPSLHAILEELASEDDSTSSDGGSSGFPIPWECNMVTSAIPIVTTPSRKETLELYTIPAVPQRTPLYLSWTPDSSPNGYWPTRRNDNTFCRTTSSAELCDDRVNSSATEWPLRLKWWTYTHTSPLLRQIGPQQPTMGSGSFPPSPRLARMWPLWLRLWTHCLHPLPTRWARCISK
jgi:hypothetical protein